jgi:hypothetical protein
MSEQRRTVGRQTGRDRPGPGVDIAVDRDESAVAEAAFGADRETAPADRRNR